MAGILDSFRSPQDIAARQQEDARQAWVNETALRNNMVDRGTLTNVPTNDVSGRGMSNVKQNPPLTANPTQADLTGQAPLNTPLSDAFLAPTPAAPVAAPTPDPTQATTPSGIRARAPRSIATPTPTGGVLNPPQDSNAPMGLRPDGTAKGLDWMGKVPMTDGSGRFMTELTANMDGYDMPLIVPTLTKDEIDYLSSGGKPTKAIFDKAYAHGIDRINQNLSPYSPTLKQPVPDMTQQQLESGLLAATPLEQGASPFPGFEQVSTAYSPDNPKAPRQQHFVKRDAVGNQIDSRAIYTYPDGNVKVLDNAGAVVETRPTSTTTPQAPVGGVFNPPQTAEAPIGMKLDSTTGKYSYYDNTPPVVKPETRELTTFEQTGRMSDATVEEIANARKGIWPDTPAVKAKFEHYEPRGMENIADAAMSNRTLQGFVGQMQGASDASFEKGLRGLPNQTQTYLRSERNGVPAISAEKNLADSYKDQGAGEHSFASADDLRGQLPSKIGKNESETSKNTAESQWYTQKANELSEAMRLGKPQAEIDQLRADIKLRAGQTAQAYANADKDSVQAGILKLTGPQNKAEVAKIAAASRVAVARDKLLSSDSWGVLTEAQKKSALDISAMDDATQTYIAGTDKVKAKKGFLGLGSAPEIPATPGRVVQKVPPGLTYVGTKDGKAVYRDATGKQGTLD